ncbi:MAG: biotin/lipoyl-binding protein, partial [Microvirga sp.]
MNVIDIFAWIVLVVLVGTLVAVFVALGTMPGRIARKRGHPWPAAVIRNSVQIIPSVAGEVIDVPVAANTPVKAGDVLFRIDPTTYQAQVQAIEAQLKLAELRL